MGMRRIAIVDDDVAAIEYLEVILDEPDFEVVGHVLDGRKALELVGSTNPDVLVLDLDMPVMGGAEVARGVRAQHPGLAIVIHSSAPASASEVPDADAFVAKSESADRLGDVIRSLPWREPVS